MRESTWRGGDEWGSVSSWAGVWGSAVGVSSEVGCAVGMNCLCAAVVLVVVIPGVEGVGGAGASVLSPGWVCLDADVTESVSAIGDSVGCANAPCPDATEFGGDGNVSVANR